MDPPTSLGRPKIRIRPRLGHLAICLLARHPLPLPSRFVDLLENILTSFTDELGLLITPHCGLNIAVVCVAELAHSHVANSFRNMAEQSSLILLEVLQPVCEFSSELVSSMSN